MDRSGGPGFRKRLTAGVVVLAAIVASAVAFLLMARSVASETPAYLQYATTIGERGFLIYGRRIAEGLAYVPRVYAEMLTGQDSTWLLLLGIPATGLALIGLVRFWRRGWRLIAVTLLLFLLGLIFIRGSIFNPRYLIQAQPMLLLASLDGLCCCVEAASRRRTGTGQLKAARTAVVVFTAIVIAANAPKVARNAFYYGPLSYTSRYYNVLREGKYADLFAVAELLKHGWPLEEPAAVETNDVGILHWLSGRRTVALPETEQRTPEDAQAVVDFVRSNRDLVYVALEWPEKAPRYRDALVKLFEDLPEWRPVPIPGTECRVYCRNPRSMFMPGPRPGP